MDWKFGGLVVALSALTFAGVFMLSPEAEHMTTVAAPLPPASGIEYASCEAYQAAHKSPLHRGEPEYRDALDPNGDGIACELSTEAREIIRSKTRIEQTPFGEHEIAAGRAPATPPSTPAVPQTKNYPPPR